MKTKGNWVIKYEDGFYYCGNNTFDKQLRKAQIYHWKEAAEEQAESLKTKRYSKVADTEWEVVAVIPPQELPEHEQVLTATYNSGFSAGYSEARDQIFKEIERALKSSKTTHVGQQFYGMILEDYLAEIKKMFGGLTK